MSHFLIKWIPVLLLLVLLNSCGKNGLVINEDEQIKIVQRGSKLIKGSEGDVELKIGDITNGAADVIIEGIDNGKVYFKKDLGEGGEGYFRYDKKYYRIKMDHFEEHLLHDDFAFVTFHQVSEEKGKAAADVVSEKMATKISPEEIRSNLDKIKTSELTFIRNGKTLDAEEMAGLLESKYLMNEKDIKTKEDFMDKVVTGSSLTGEAYKVLTAKNDTLLLADWLNSH